MLLLPVCISGCNQSSEAEEFPRVQPDGPVREMNHGHFYGWWELKDVPTYRMNEMTRVEFEKAFGAEIALERWEFGGNGTLVFERVGRTIVGTWRLERPNLLHITRPDVPIAMIFECNLDGDRLYLKRQSDNLQLVLRTKK